MKFYAKINQSRALYDAAASILKNKGYEERYPTKTEIGWCVAIEGPYYYGVHPISQEHMLIASGYEEIGLAELVTELPDAPAPIFKFASGMTARKTTEGIRFASEKFTVGETDLLVPHGGIQKLFRLSGYEFEVLQNMTFKELVSLVKFAD